jgi:NAD(P) transhydrogenase subunit alpha
MNVFVPKERPGENRVAATPETVKKLVREGLAVEIEAGAGETAHFLDAAYREAGATVAGGAGGDGGAGGWRAADLVLKVAPPTPEEARRLKSGAVLVGFLAPDRNLDAVRALLDRKVSALAMELIPRVTRAQPMDALSSQASIAGYKAVVLAASRLGRYFPLLMTAAGTIPPSRVVVMGAGVAGLQAIATAKRLGALVEVSDIRPAVREQVESLGGRFIELPPPEGGESGEGAGGYAREMTPEFLARQREIVARHVSAADVVITTALVPGKPAPKLVSREMVEAMRPGSVIVDLAVEQGGNCELSRPGEEVVHRGVVVLGPGDLASQTPLDASTLYARNVFALVQELLHEGAVRLDRDDEIVAGALLTHGGELLHAPTAERLQEVVR